MHVKVGSKVGISNAEFWLQHRKKGGGSCGGSQTVFVMKTGACICNSPFASHPKGSFFSLQFWCIANALQYQGQEARAGERYLNCAGWGAGSDGESWKILAAHDAWFMYFRQMAATAAAAAVGQSCHEMLMMPWLGCFHNPPTSVAHNRTHTRLTFPIHIAQCALSPYMHMPALTRFYVLSPRRITSWSTWPNCSNQLSPIRRRVIRSRRRYCSGRRIWSGSTASSSGCAATWPRCKVASCPIRRWVMATKSDHCRRPVPPNSTCQRDKANAINGGSTAGWRLYNSSRTSTLVQAQSIAYILRLL